MATKLNKHSFEFAQDLVKNGNTVSDQRDDWSEHKPSTRQENEFIERHGWDEFANWHLGIDPEASEHTKARYKYPYGDFTKVHRCGVLSAESRAGRNKHQDVEDATIRLRDLRDQLGISVEVPPHELMIADRLLAARAALAEEPDERTRAALGGLLRAS